MLDLLCREEFSGHLVLNKYVKNAVCVRRALEAMPGSVIGRTRPVGIEISFLAEAFFGDSILSWAVPESVMLQVENDPSLVFLDQIVNASTSAELTHFRTR